MKPRLLIILNRLVVGGQSIDTVPLAKHLQQHYDIMIVYGEKENDEEAYTDISENTAGIVFNKIPSLKRSVNPLNDVAAFYALYKCIKKFNPSVVHTHGSKPGFTGRLSAWFAGVPVIIHTFHGHLFHSYYNKIVSFIIIRFERLLGRLSTKVVVLSTQQKLEITSQYKIVDPEKAVVIPLGIDEKTFTVNSLLFRETFRKQYLLNEGDVAVGIIGRMVPVKNHKLFIDIIIALEPLINNKTRFFIIGDGDLKNELQLRLNNARINWSETGNDSTAKVIFTSWVTPITTVLHGLDIVVLTSLNEGTPLSIIEAQICGKPVVAANTGGVRDTLIDNESGFLVNSYNPAHYADKLKLLIESKDLQINMGIKARNFAKEKFSRQTEVDAFINLYANCIRQTSNN